MKSAFVLAFIIAIIFGVSALQNAGLELVARDDMEAPSKTADSNMMTDNKITQQPKSGSPDATENMVTTSAPKTKEPRNKKAAESDQVSIISKSNKDEQSRNLLNAQKTWCNDNANFCNNICLNITAGSPSDKRCNYKTLAWNCVCGNGTVPDQKIFTFPITYYQCTKEVETCKNLCGSDSACSLKCSHDKNCTAINDPNAGKIASELDPSQFGSNKSNSDESSSSYINRDYLFSGGSLISANTYLFGLSVIVLTFLHLDA